MIEEREGEHVQFGGDRKNKSKKQSKNDKSVRKFAFEKRLKLYDFIGYHSNSTPALPVHFDLPQLGPKSLSSSSLHNNMNNFNNNFNNNNNNDNDIEEKKFSSGKKKQRKLAKSSPASSSENEVQKCSKFKKTAKLQSEDRVEDRKMMFVNRNNRDDIVLLDETIFRVQRETKCTHSNSALFNLL